MVEITTRLLELQKETESLITEAMAEELYDFMLILQQDVIDQLSVKYPPSSDLGEPPRERTGNLKSSVSIYPTSVKHIARLGYMRIFYEEHGWYGNWLAENWERMGIPEMVEGAMQGGNPHRAKVFKPKGRRRRK